VPLSVCSAYAPSLCVVHAVNAYTEDDCIRNFKIIDQAFRTCGVQKEIPCTLLFSGSLFNFL
jgi:hypothetical protein